MLQFIEAGGPFMWLLVAASVISLGFIIERGFALRWGKVIPPSVEAAVCELGDADGLARVREVCVAQPSTVSRLLLLVHDHAGLPREEIVDVLQTQARHEVVRLERGLVVLEVVVGIAPLLGLVGTIHGLITLFGDLGRADMGDNSALAKGIAITLNTTLGGLLVAIPSMVAWSYFTRKVETLAVELETLCDDFLRRQQRLG